MPLRQRALHRRLPPLSNPIGESLEASRPRSADREGVQVEVAAQSAAHDAPQPRSSSSMEYAPAFHRVDGRRTRLHLGNADAERQPPSPHTAGETDNKSARRRPDTRQYVAASTGTGKTHVGQTGALTGLRYAPNFRNYRHFAAKRERARAENRKEEPVRWKNRKPSALQSLAQPAPAGGSRALKPGRAGTSI